MWITEINRKLQNMIRLLLKDMGEIGYLATGSSKQGKENHFMFMTH